MDFRYAFGQSVISLKNIKVTKHLMFHSIVNNSFYPGVRQISLVNVPLAEDCLLLLLEFVRVFSKNLERIEIVNIALSDQVIEVLSKLISKAKLKQLTISKCGLKSKPFGKICLAILEGRSVESVDFSYNFIGKRAPALKLSSVSND